jgi:hypothetical protein
VTDPAPALPRDLALSRELTRVALGVEGVVELYPAGSPALLAASILDPGDDAKVAVSRSGEGVDVGADICVDAGHPAPGTVRAVGAALAAHLAAAGFAGRIDVSVRVSRIAREPRAIL